jgi:hypothetical protein
MTAEIVQIRDYQSKRAIERAHKELEKEAAKILTPFVETTGFTDTSPSEMIPYHGTGIDGMDLGKEPA